MVDAYARSSGVYIFDPEFFFLKMVSSQGFSLRMEINEEVVREDLRTPYGLCARFSDQNTYHARPRPEIHVMPLCWPR